MPMTPKLQERIVREAIRRAAKQAEVWRKFLTAGGYMAGFTPMTKEEKGAYYVRLAPHLPELMARDPEAASDLVRQIDALLAAEE